MTFSTLRKLSAGALAWGLLWACGYSPADYPARLAVRAFGSPSAVRNSGMRWEGPGHVSVEFQLEDGSVIRDMTHPSAQKSKGGIRLLELDLAGSMKIHRTDRGFPFGVFDYVVTLGMGFLALRLWFPGFLGRHPVAPRAGAPRLPMTVLKAADIAAAVCALLGPFLYSPAQACVTTAIWLTVRFARLRGFVEFIELRHPAAAPPLLAIPASDDAAVRRAPEPWRASDSFFALSTREGWSRVPASALAAGFLILAVVKARNSLVAVPEPGYLLFGLELGTWSVIGWSLVALAIAFSAWEFIAAWRRSEE